MIQTKENMAILFERIIPYLDARLKSLSTMMNFTCVEFCRKDSTYLMKLIQEKPPYKKVTLFENGDYRRYPASVLLNKTFEALDKVNPSAVAIIGWYDRISLSALLWCLEKGVPALFMGDNTEKDSRRWKPMEWVKSNLLSGYRSALVAGTPQKSYLLKLGFSPGSIYLGYDVVDNDYFAKKAGRARKNKVAIRKKLKLPGNYFLASCRFIPQKNLLKLIQAYSKYIKLVTDPWTLVITGDGPEKERMVRDIQRLGLADNVLLPGFIQYEQLPDYYGLAKAFILPSLSEPWGLVVNEAMASGLPVLVSDRCGCSEDLVQNGINGFTFDYSNPDQLAELMARMSTLSPKKIKSMGEKSLEIIHHWHPRNFSKNLHAAFEAALQAPQPTTPWYIRPLIRFLISRGFRIFRKT